VNVERGLVWSFWGDRAKKSVHGGRRKLQGRKCRPDRKRMAGTKGGSLMTSREGVSSRTPGAKLPRFEAELRGVKGSGDGRGRTEDSISKRI